MSDFVPQDGMDTCWSRFHGALALWPYALVMYLMQQTPSKSLVDFILLAACEDGARLVSPHCRRVWDEHCCCNCQPAVQLEELDLSNGRSPEN